MSKPFISKALFGMFSTVMNTDREFEKTLTHSRIMWRENQKARFDLSDKELDSLLDIDKKFTAIGFPGWYDKYISSIECHNVLGDTKK